MDSSDGPSSASAEAVGWKHKHLFIIDPKGQTSTKCRELLSPNYNFVHVGRVAFGFGTITLAVILLSSVQLALEGPPGSLDHRPSYRHALYAFEIMFTILFGVEVVIRVLAQGLVLHRGSFLRSWWSVLDVVVVVSSVLNLSWSTSTISFVRALRLLRCLRPLRVIAKSSGLRLVVSTLMQAVGGIVNAATLCLLVWLMFAVLGVQLFSGRLNECKDPVDFPPGMPLDGVRINGTVIVPPCRDSATISPNYDNVANAFLALFVLTSQEDWPTFMYQGVDTTGEDRTLKRDATPGAAYFFIVFVAISSFFLLSLFIGVLFESFKRQKKLSDNFSILSDNQREWVNTQRRLLKRKPDRALKVPSRFWRRICFWVVQSPVFTACVTLFVFLNILVLGATFYGESSEWQHTKSRFNDVFIALFTLEAVLKINAFTWKQYIRDGWNVLDFLIVVASLFDVVITNAVNSSTVSACGCMVPAGRHFFCRRLPLVG